jgi:predicted DNA-binding antitoxin AbrB/MazE fold protein
MKQTLDAIYENGVFRPLTSPEIPDGQPVKLIVQIAYEVTPDDMLQLAARVYEGLPVEDIDEIENIALGKDR